MEARQAGCAVRALQPVTARHSLWQPRLAVA